MLDALTNLSFHLGAAWPFGFLRELRSHSVAAHWPSSDRWCRPRPPGQWRPFMARGSVAVRSGSSADMLALKPPRIATRVVVSETVTFRNPTGASAPKEMLKNNGAG